MTPMTAMRRTALDLPWRESSRLLGAMLTSDEWASERARTLRIFVIPSSAVHLGLREARTSLADILVLTIVATASGEKIASAEQRAS